MNRPFGQQDVAKRAAVCCALGWNNEVVELLVKVRKNLAMDGCVHLYKVNDKIGVQRVHNIEVDGNKVRDQTIRCR